MLSGIVYTGAGLQLLDQRLLPLEEQRIQVENTDEAWQLIKDMAVRGAPAIAIAAVLSLCVETKAKHKQLKSVGELADFVVERMQFLETSRPTAVNLMEASQKVQGLAAAWRENQEASVDDVVKELLEFGDAMLAADVASNKAIGQHGREALQRAVPARRKLRVLTHCNTGALACAAYGTALGVIRALHAAGELEHAYCTETRPYNQGARLTAFELVSEKMPATLIVDSAAAALMAEGRVDAVVVGADRVVSNGDTANKVGTLMLATLAKAYNIPFFVAAPVTTLDAALSQGSEIVIEQRNPDEVTHFQGKRVVVEGIKVWNPSFDVTPSKLIRDIITDQGCVPRQGQIFDVASMVATSNGKAAENGQAPADQDEEEASDFKELTEETMPMYLEQHKDLALRLGGKPEQWNVREVGDGNINFVYIVEGPRGAICVKQGAPYIRIVKEWKLTQDRIRIQAAAMREQHRIAPAYIPELYHMDSTMSLVAMQYLPPPHVTLRVGALAGGIYPRLAQQMGGLLADTLFRTSALVLTGAKLREMVVEFSNPEMCALTEQVIFTDPYYDAPMNRWTSPQLDTLVREIRQDAQLKLAATEMKHLFLTKTEALLHGDLHIGSLMVTEDTCYSIDPEFAFYGPIGFDVGKFLSSLALLFLATRGHVTPENPLAKQRAWLLRCIHDTWQVFVVRFRALWDEYAAKGELFPETVFGRHVEQTKQLQDSYLQGLWRDSLGFLGTSCIRRLVGIAHLEDFDSIQDVEVKAACEARAIQLGIYLLKKGRHVVQNPNQLVDLLENLDADREWQLQASSPDLSGRTSSSLSRLSRTLS